MHVESVVRLRNFVVLIKTGVQHSQVVRVKTHFDFGNLFLVPVTPSGTKGSCWPCTDGRKKTYLCFTSLETESTSNIQEQAGSTLLQKALLKCQWHLILFKVVPVNLCLI